MIRDLICKRCEKIVGQEESKKATKPKKVKLCTKCKEVSLLAQKLNLQERNTNQELRAANSERMKSQNPMHDSSICDKVSKTLKVKYDKGELKSTFQDSEKLTEIKAKWKITEDGRKRLSDRMKLDNPRFNPESSRKSSETFKERVKSGQIVFKHGPEHHLWKGNRSFSDTVRTQLYTAWTYKCLERDNFTCTKCTSKRNLTVHHLRPLRDFIKDVQAEYQIDSFHNIDSSLWQPYIDKILFRHRIEDGITLCKKCHSDADEYYNFRDNSLQSKSA